MDGLRFPAATFPGWYACAVYQPGAVRAPRRFGGFPALAGAVADVLVDADVAGRAHVLRDVGVSDHDDPGSRAPTHRRRVAAFVLSAAHPADLSSLLRVPDFSAR